MTPDEPVEGRERVIAAIQELRRKLAAGEDTGTLMVPDPSRWRRLCRWYLDGLREQPRGFRPFIACGTLLVLLVPFEMLTVWITR